MIIIYCLLLIVSLILLGKWMWKRRSFYRASIQFDGPLAYPIIGNAWKLRNLNENSITFDKLFAKFKSPMRFWIGLDFYIFIHEPEDVEVVLKSPNCIERMFTYSFMSKALKFDGLFTTSDVPQWKFHRKLLSPTFSLVTLYNHLPIFQKHSKLLIKQLMPYVNREPFDIKKMINVAAFNMFLESTLGSNVSEKEKEIFCEYVTEAQELISKRLYQPWYHFEWLWAISGYKSKVDKFSKYGSDLLEKIIKINLQKDSSADYTFLDRLIQISDENQNFNLADVKGEAQSLLMAATDTSSVAIAFTILMLAIHPEYQQRAIEELETILPTENTEILREHLEKMTYLELCINESLRLFPPVSMIGRSNKVPIKIKNMEIPPNSSIVISIRQIMRKTKYWGNDALQYNPDHFLPENMAGKHPSCFIPFSQGIRNCIADKYAVIVVKTMVAILIRNFEFTSPFKLADLRVRMDINTRLLNGHFIQMKKRNF